jgi:2-oxoisovalerate dehydrogenase E2 component (dihydrolipoyl transacylase)
VTGKTAASDVFVLPDLGEGLQDAEIVAWNVGVGDHVVADQPLLSVETDKAVVEIPSPHAGRIAELLAEPGARVPVGAPLVRYEGGTHADTGTVVGAVATDGDGGDAAPARNAGGAGEGGGGATGKAPARARATPAVRARAKALGVDLAAVAPTGPDGTVSRADVERAAETLARAGPLETLRGVRRAMARNMALAGAQVVPATVTALADVEAWTAGTDVTVRLARAIVAACAAEPSLNAWYDAAAEGRRLHARVDLGIAVDTPDGLIVPVLRDCGGRDAADLRAGLDRMVADVRARTVPAEELRGPTLTLSNFGMIAGEHAALVVVPPQVAIVGAGRLAPRVVAADGVPAVHRTLPLSLTFDHRVVDGGEAARFLAALVADLERAA